MVPRILGLDYGTKRIGVAVSDALGLLAHPLTTVQRQNRSSDMEAIRLLIQQEECGRIVIGLPLRTDGTEGPECQAVRRFAQSLGRVIEGVEIVLCDERYSTFYASDRLLETSRTRKKRRAKIDQSAAAVILQSYLDALSEERVDRCSERKDTGESNSFQE